MRKVKIFGAGSIGNHLAHASRMLGWEVLICDIDEKALERTKHSIYPARYGSWDEAIRLSTVDQAPKGGFDIIVVGTPPDTHMKIAWEALKESPSLILVEKPLCTPALETAEEFRQAANHAGVKVCVGYNHVVSSAAGLLEELLGKGIIGEVLTLDVEFREHWGGIFKAHPWLRGPQDSYLGFSARGGGASGEHSHAANLWQHFAHVCGFGHVTEINAFLQCVQSPEVDYDSLCVISARTERGLTGRIVQDVVTIPTRKWVKVQGTEGALEWHINYNAEGDMVFHFHSDGTGEEFLIKKTRVDDFLREVEHLDAFLSGKVSQSPISLEYGLDTMLLIHAVHRSNAERRNFTIDYTHGCVPEGVLATGQDV